MIKALVFDCFGVIYRDAFKEFLYMNAVALSDFLNDKPCFKKTGFPQYYYELARQVDMKEITEDVFYKTLSDAAHIPPLKIKEDMNTAETMLKEDIFEFIKKLKLSKKCKIVIVANADRQFLQKFLDYKNIKKISYLAFTSSEAKAPKSDFSFFKALINKINVSMDEILYIDDSINNILAAKSYKIAAVQFVNLEQLKVDLIGYI